MARPPPSPAAFKARQHDVLAQVGAAASLLQPALHPPPAATAPNRCRHRRHPQAQAAGIEAFLGQRRRASQQQQARTTWLLAQQRLEQEAADCEAQLLACLEGSAATAAALCDPSPSAEQERAASASTAASDAAAAAALISEAVEMAAAATRWRAAGQAPAGLQVALEPTQQSLRQQLAELQSTAGQLLSQVQQAARSCTVPADSTAPGGLAERAAALCARHPLAPTSCTADLCAQAAELEARHMQQRQQRAAAWQDFLQASRDSTASAAGSRTGADSVDGGGTEAAAEDGTCAAHTADGWSAEEHAAFLHERTASLAAPAGQAQAALRRQLAALLPARSREAVLAHERWYREASRLQAAAQQGEAGARQEAADWLAAAAALLAEAVAGRLAQAEAALQRLEGAAACWQASEAAGQLRQERAGQQAAAELAELEAAAAVAAEQAQQQLAAQQYRARMKQLLAEHRERREAAAEATAATAQAEARAAAQEAAAAAAAARVRVQHRAQQLAAKQAARQQQEVQRQQERERRRSALGRLARQVAPDVQRDAARATGPTESSSSAAGAAGEGGQRLFARALGFTADDLLADQRLKARGGGVAGTAHWEVSATAHW